MTSQTNLELHAKQVEMEQEMGALGARRFMDGINKAMENNRGMDIGAVQKAVAAFIPDVADAINELVTKKTRGRNHSAKARISQVDPLVAAYITFATIVNMSLDLRRTIRVQTLAVRIGSRLEDELHVEEFREQQGGYWAKLSEDLLDRTSDPRVIHRNLIHASNKLGVQHDEWTEAERLHVGMFLLNVAVTDSALFYKHNDNRPMNTTVSVQPTDEFLHWLDKNHEALSLLRPARMPCIVPPVPWTGARSGGYHTYAMRKTTCFVKAVNKEHEGVIASAHHAGCMDDIMRCVNKIQATPWRVNNDVLDVFTRAFDSKSVLGLPSLEPLELPNFVDNDGNVLDPLTMGPEHAEDFHMFKMERMMIHRLEEERKRDCLTVQRSLAIANKYKEFDNVYFVHNVDFRGRMYANTSGINPQGSDLEKALLYFANTKSITERGAYWLRVHVANTYGYDKAPFDGRNNWVLDNEQAIRAVAEDPLGTGLSFLSGADKPWCFLAAAQEYIKYADSGYDPEFQTRIAVAMDGSCNGLQHYSAMLRDAVGGAATNLTPADTPQDIYQEVADAMILRLRADGSEQAQWWLNSGINRKLTKKAVMTLPYGSTRRTWTDSIQDWLRDYNKCSTNKEVVKYAEFAVNFLSDAIADVVKAAPVAMKWLQNVARIKSRDNQYMLWYTPMGFPVYQNFKNTDTTIIETRLCGRICITLESELETTNNNKQANGVAPNFVHGNDATHMYMTVDCMPDVDFAMIHDSYGVHPADVDLLQQTIRDQFVVMYRRNVLLDFATDMGRDDLPELPEFGTLDLSEVHNSRYFFA